MKNIVILIALLCVPFSVQGETIMDGLTPVAVTQSGSSCWAAAGSEEIWASGWSVQSTPVATYQDMISHLGTAPGSTWYGVDWYFDTYWPSVKTSDVMKSGWGLGSVEYDIKQGWATAVETFSRSGVIGHGLAVWGMEEDANTLKGLYFTNSYGNTSLQYSPVSDNAWYYIPGYVGTIVGLVPFDDYIPSPDPPYMPPPQCPPPSVDEPSIFMLMLIGMVIIGGIERRRTR